MLSYSYPALAEECGTLTNHFGPFDYRKSGQVVRLELVEHQHFTDVTYSLAIRGASTQEYFKKFVVGPRGTQSLKNTPIPKDIDYTLRAFPNHPRALYAMSEYQRLTGYKGGGARGFRSAECYYIRALKLVSDDPIVYMLYGLHFHKRKKYNKALVQYKKAKELNKDNVELIYNMGILYLSMGNIEKAQEYSDQAYSKKYPLPGLREKIKEYKRKK